MRTPVAVACGTALLPCLASRPNMSLCDYCGEKAGWFQSSHPACVAKVSSAGGVVQKLVFDGTLAGRSYENLFAEFQKVLTDNSVAFKYVRNAALQGWNDATSQIAL